MDSPSSLPLVAATRSLLPLILTTLLGACASVGPDYHAPVTQVPAVWQAPTAGTHQVERADLARW